MVCWRYASSRLLVAGLGRMGNATGFRPRSCARTRRWQAHDYRKRAGLLRAGEIRSVEILFRLVLSANRIKLGPGGGASKQEMSRTAFVGDQVTHGGQKGFGMTKHGRSGHATRSPRFRFLQKLEAQKNDRKDRSRIKDPKQSIEELFHPRKPTRT